MCECCEDTDPSSVLEKLRRKVRNGVISEGVLLKLLQALKQKAPSSFPALLLSLLEDVDRNPPQAEGKNQLFGPTRLLLLTVTFVSSLWFTADSEMQDESRNEEKPEVEKECSKEQPEEDEKEPDVEPSSSPSAGSRPYICSWCKKTFDFKCRMLSHIKRCSMSQDCELQCPQCPKKLANQRALQRHRAEAHPGSLRVKKKVACDLCGRTFAHPSGEWMFSHLTLWRGQNSEWK